MTKYLLVFNTDWADEFDCEKYAIYNNLEAAEAIVASYIENGGYFGTNEGWEEDELYEGCFTITEISEDEAEVLIRLLGHTFGTGLA